MRILNLPAYFTPEIAASNYLDDNRNEDFAKAGIEIEVHVSSPTRGITVQQIKEYKKKRTEYFFNGKLKVFRFKMFQEPNSILLRALRYFICWFIQLYKGLQSKNIDIIFVSSTPPIQGALAATLKRIKRIPFVYNLQDIFPDSLVSTGITNKGSMLWKIGRIIENYTYASADKIIVISEDFKNNILAKGVPENKIIVINNWVDENAVKPIKREDNSLFVKFNLDKTKFYVTYCGNIGLTQNLELLVTAAEELRLFIDIHFLIFGDGIYKSEIVSMINEKRISNITILPFQPYESISEVFSLGDVGLVISKKNVSQNSVPSKTWSIMAAERPVLINFDEKSELSSLVKNHNFGIVTDVDNINSFKNGILTLYNDKTLCLELGKNGRKYIEENLSREVSTQRYIQVVNSIIKQ